MGFDYLKLEDGTEQYWSDVTRDERYFCAELFFEIRQDTKKFIHWLNDNKFCLFNSSELISEWEIGFEVCFYRDYIHSFHNKEKHTLLKSKRLPENVYSPKRTFDLCLFSNNKIIIIEAKAQAKFHSKQNKEFEQDIMNVKNLLKLNSLKNVEVIVVALASSIYFENIKKKSKGLPSIFANRKFNWKSLIDDSLIGGPFSSNIIFSKADSTYNN